ncbi:hypothetical protein HanXRQr2_Chr04g0158281 [Helianthus annuus]|uniref:Uncharacterized protein n=1 Tax=Helianthus annuus TaxID=4232 RepID=A0A9K3J715_HELAN|nr:hypothetical protein HanXRQr2_Chr04g0158281 [Helianthus annuus]
MWNVVWHVKVFFIKITFTLSVWKSKSGTLLLFGLGILSSIIVQYVGTTSWIFVSSIFSYYYFHQTLGKVYLGMTY